MSCLMSAPTHPLVLASNSPLRQPHSQVPAGPLRRKRRNAEPGRLTRIFWPVGSADSIINVIAAALVLLEFRVGG